MRIAFRYWLDKNIRDFVMWGVGLATRRSDERQLDLRRQPIKRILLVRGIFRMGSSILATPAIFLMHKNFPSAEIDFLGPPISEILFQNLPINRHYQIHRSFPKACWVYWVLIRRIRSVHYDLALDVSGSRTAMGAFIVGFSGARHRAGLKGKWDQWFNVRLPRPAETNKYRNLPALIASLGLETQKLFPSLILSAMEKEEGKRRVEEMVGLDQSPIVAVFVGGRKARGKRWPKESFLQLVTGLYAEKARVIVFLGPEEREWSGFFIKELPIDISVVFEPSPRIFASLVSNCDLFVACDSGPIHLACALQVRTVAVFLKPNFGRWGPPSSLGRIVYQKAGVLPREVLEVCLLELSSIGPKFTETVAPSPS